MTQDSGMPQNPGDPDNTGDVHNLTEDASLGQAVLADGGLHCEPFLFKASLIKRLS